MSAKPPNFHSIQSVNSMPAPCGLFFARVCHYQMNLLKYLQAAGVPAVEKKGPFIVRRNVGWKINNVLHNQRTTANVTWVAWSLLRWKGEE